MTREQQVSPGGRITYRSLDEPHAVYRAYDGKDRLLYIGTSHNPKARLKAHRYTTAWGKQVARWTEEWYPDWAAAVAAEHAAIRAERPAYNVTSTPLALEVTRPDLPRDQRKARIAAAYKARDEHLAAEWAASGPPEDGPQR